MSAADAAVGGRGGWQDRGMGRGTDPRDGADGRRDLAALPKAHLHLHFTGSMRPATLLDLAAGTASTCRRR